MNDAKHNKRVLIAYVLVILFYAISFNASRAQCPKGYIKVYKELDTIVAPCTVIIQPVEHEAHQRITIKEQRLKIDEYKKLVPQKIKVTDSLKAILQNYKVAYENHNFEIEEIRKQEQILIKSYSQQLISSQNSNYKLHRKRKRLKYGFLGSMGLNVLLLLVLV